MIYTDGAHIISDAGLQELHWFAERVGISRYYFDNEKELYKKPKILPAYVLTAKGAKFNYRKIQEKLIP